MAHVLNLLVAASSSSPVRATGGGLNLLQVLLAVLTVILLILFVGFILSGRRRGKAEDADDGILRPSAPHTPHDGANPQERVIYHAQPRIMAPFAGVVEAAVETGPEPDLVEATAPVEPDPPPDQPAPPEVPAVTRPAPPLTAWARSPSAAPASPDGGLAEPSRVAPASKAPPFIFPSTQRPEAPPNGVEAPAAPGNGRIAGPSAAPPAQAALAPQSVSDAQPLPAASAATAPGANGGQEAELILLIEDDERIAKFYSILFQAKGFRVENARDGIEGVDMAQALRPALILLDVMMPRMNGLMVLQVLRANPETAKTPVVVLSNYMEPPLIQRALQLGAIEYVVKSQARPEQLVNALPSWLKGEPAIH